MKKGRISLVVLAAVISFLIISDYCQAKQQFVNAFRRSVMGGETLEFEPGQRILVLSPPKSSRQWGPFALNQDASVTLAVVSSHLNSDKSQTVVYNLRSTMPAFGLTGYVYAHHPEPYVKIDYVNQNAIDVILVKDAPAADSLADELEIDRWLIKSGLNNSWMLGVDICEQESDMCKPSYDLGDLVITMPQKTKFTLILEVYIE